MGQPPQAERTATGKDTKLLTLCQSPWEALKEARDRFWFRKVSPRPHAAESCLLSSSPCHCHQPHLPCPCPAAPLGCCCLPWGSGCRQQQHLSSVSTPESVGGKKVLLHLSFWVPEGALAVCHSHKVALSPGGHCRRGSLAPAPCPTGSLKMSR